jgi:diguanylate cyclase (GGDEF)-like protein
MEQATFPKRLASAVLVAAAYFVAGKLGLRLAIVHPSATLVWAPAGIALASLLLFGRRMWPAILVAAFLVNLTTAGSVATSLGIAIGNTLEAVVGAMLVERFAGGRNPFERTRDVFMFVLFAGVLSTCVSPTIGIASLVAGGYAHWADFGRIWLTWWAGDATGNIVVAPLLLLWATPPRQAWRPERIPETVAMVLTLGVVGFVVFGGALPASAQHYPLEFLCLPVLIWAAFRFPQREVAAVIVAMAGMAVYGTIHGFGPFVRGSENSSLLLLHAFMGVKTVTTLAISAVVAERARAEASLRHLAATDPLTGLANYRAFNEALTEEIDRTQRSGRPFTVLLLDLDGLKKINDRYGHLVGSEALRRVAVVLEAQCRAVDTAARYGGDEFAVVLVETGEAAAQQVAVRIMHQLSQDRAEPPLSVSIGGAVYPEDGVTGQALLLAADHALYEMKSGKSLPTGKRPALKIVSRQ